MAVDHTQRARWAHRVLRLREGGVNLSLDDVQSTAGAVERTPDPDVQRLENELGVGEVDAHVVGAAGHPLTGLFRSFADLGDDDNYIGKLFEMDVDELLEAWRKETTEAHEQIVSHIDQLPKHTIAMSRNELNAAYDSQDDDEGFYDEQAEEMTGTGAWPDPHRLGHGFAMQKEADR